MLYKYYRFMQTTPNSFKDSYNITRPDHRPFFDGNVLDGLTDIIFSCANRDLCFHGFENDENFVFRLNDVSSLTLDFPDGGK